jgi:hypothetical protein
LVQQPDKAPLLSEEVVVAGLVHGREAPAAEWLTDAEALRLLAQAQPDANIPMPEKRELIEHALAAWPEWQAPLGERIALRAAELEKSHKRVRQAVGLKVRQLTVSPQLPPDLLGVLALQPVV